MFWAYVGKHELKGFPDFRKRNPQIKNKPAVSMAASLFFIVLTNTNPESLC
ncbi:hypothetical protein HMPREF1141_2953 [Clostridium sp. MSTE9]|nr:hypothetical protein HMPREF1141_2953 [Clostridium sp. MSTE9]